MKIRITKFVPGIAFFFISLWLFTMPGSEFPHEDWFDLLQVDKLVHISLFLILCFLFMLPIKKTGMDKKAKLPWFLLITVAAIAYGIIIEFVQRDFIPNRSFDVWDIAADMAGCLIAFFWLRKKG